MPKSSDQDENWAARERLRVIERALWWRGWVRRSDLTELFGVSAAHASGDLQKYLELNPGALVYHTSRKRYEATPKSKWVLQEPNFEEALTVFLSGGERVLPGQVEDGDQIAGVGLPVRAGKPEIARCLMMAVLQGLTAEVEYFSVSSGKHHWRTIYPHAFGNDGYRWHTRAYCAENNGYRDFVISRVNGVKWPQMHDELLPDDTEWEEFLEIKLKPHHDLTANQRRAIELDYGIASGGVLTLRVRKAMEFYLKHHLKIVTENESRHFELA